MSTKLRVKLLGDREIPRVTTGVGKAMWPRLHAPDDRFEEERYKVNLRVDRDEPWAQELIELIDSQHQMAIDEAKAELARKRKASKKKTTKRSPSVKVCEDLPYRTVFDENEEETGEVDFVFKMKAVVKPKKGEPYEQRPKLFAADKSRLEDVAVGTGSMIRVCGDVAVWENPALGVGVSLRLQSVQVIELEEAFEGSAEDYGFDEVEGAHDEVEEGDGGGDEEDGDF